MEVARVVSMLLFFSIMTLMFSAHTGELFDSRVQQVYGNFVSLYLVIVLCAGWDLVRLFKGK